MLQDLQHVGVGLVIGEVHSEQLRLDLGEAGLRVAITKRLQRIEYVVCILARDLPGSRGQEVKERIFN